MTTATAAAARLSAIPMSEGAPRVDRLYTAGQAADYLNTTEWFVRRLIAERRIPFHRVGRHVRIAEADLVRFVHEGRVETVSLAWQRHRPAGVA